MAKPLILKMKKHAVLIVLFIICLVGVCIADDKQQKTFEEVRKAYSLMEEGDYDKAGRIFDEYLSMHSSGTLYWFFVEKINGSDSLYTYKNVMSTRSVCDGLKDY